MIKFKHGEVASYDGYVVKDIIVKAKIPNHVKDILVGGGLVALGITYLTTTAFKHGSKAFEEAEYKALHDIGVII